MSKKKLLSLALVVIMIATISFSTLAWFSDSASVENEFMVAGSDNQNPDEIFSVEVWENVPGETTYEGHTYENILPGDSLKKQVYVENTGSYDQYMRVIVTISDAEAWVAALGEEFNAATLFGGFEPTAWTHVWNNLSESNGVIPENLIFVLYHKEIVPVEGCIKVFDTVNIPTSLTQEQAAAFAGGFTIDIKAQAVQTENVVPAGTAAEDAAWAAFQTVGMGIGD